MPSVPNFVGPSYNLDDKAASVQRTINMVPVPLEAGNERSPWVFADAPGLTVWSSDSGGDPDSPWNSSNETPTDSWEFTESDYVAELIFA